MSDTSVPDHIEKYNQARAYGPVDFSLATVTEDKVEYYLFKDAKQKTGKYFTHSSIAELEFDRTLPTKLFFHGWTTNTTSPWYPLLKNEYFAKLPCNIIYVDWSYAGDLTYPESTANIDLVGGYIAQLLMDLQVIPENLHLVGHSLGSHLTGFIGRHYFRVTGQKLARITALDPAGPGFYGTPPEARLTSNDAEFVDVHHTDIGHYGYLHPMGHVDFYPNGGRNQPGFEASTDENLSHARSTLFFVESVNTKVRSKQGILDEANLWVTEVPDGNIITFGDDVEWDARGIYCLVTNANPPYLIPDESDD